MSKVIVCYCIILVWGVALCNTKDDVEKAIVRVKSDLSYSTGFFWRDSCSVITTLHSISNKNDIEIKIPGQREWVGVKLHRIYKDADLVLLKTINYKSNSYLMSKNWQRPEVGSEVYTLGYNSGNNRYQDRDFKVGKIEGDKLKDLLPISAEKEIKKLGFPSLNTEIIYLKGHLLHGFSGSPILDNSGVLIGVADGGLENGASGISWCIPSKFLLDLEVSKEEYPNLANSNVKTLFSSQNRDDEEIRISKRGFTFIKTKTRTFEELNKTGNYSSNTELGLHQMLSQYRAKNIPFEDFEYDIYVEEKSGATVVIPSDMKLKEDHLGFYAISANKQNFIRIKIHSLLTNNFVNQASIFDVNQASISFENFIQRETRISSWILDYALTFRQPFFRPDNTVIYRKAYVNHMPNKYLFEVLAAKDGTFMGLYAVMQNSFDPYRRMFINPIEAARIHLATQLSTFTF